MSEEITRRVKFKPRRKSKVTPWAVGLGALALGGWLTFTLGRAKGLSTTQNPADAMGYTVRLYIPGASPTAAKVEAVAVTGMKLPSAEVYAAYSASSSNITAVIYDYKNRMVHYYGSPEERAAEAAAVAAGK